MNIKMSRKHGLNPTVPICFFCGETKNEVALLGRINSPDGKEKDIEAPSHCIINYEPCDECKEKMKNGITIISVTTQPNTSGQMAIQKTENQSLYPTGKWVVVKHEAMKRILIPDVYETVAKTGKMLMPDDDFTKLIESAGSNESQ